MVKDLKDYIQLGKSESASFKELSFALFSGGEAITSFKHQSHKIRKKRAPKHGSNPVLVLVQLGVAFLSTHNYWQNAKCHQLLEANKSSPSAPHQSHWTSIHRLLRDPSMRRLFKNCGGKKHYVHVYTEGQNAFFKKKFQNSGNQRARGDNSNYFLVGSKGRKRERNNGNRDGPTDRERQPKGASLACHLSSQI